MGHNQNKGLELYRLSQFDRIGVNKKQIWEISNEYVWHLDGPPLWSSGQNSCLQIQMSVFDSRHYQIFWEVVGLERGPLSLMSTTEELLERKVAASVLESRDYGRRDPSRWPRGTL
jgi:hypothetical protein